MSPEQPKEYELFDGGCTAFVDYAKKRVVVDERGGWGRRYDMSFDALTKHAATWQMKFDPAAPEAELVDIGARLILGEEALSHGLSADRYLKAPTTLSAANKKIVQEFKRLIQTHGSDLVARGLGVEVRAQLQKSIEMLL